MALFKKAFHKLFSKKPEEDEHAEHVETLENIDLHANAPEVSSFVPEDLKKLEEEEKDMAELLEKMKHRVAHPISLKHRALMQVIGHAYADVEKQRKLLKKLANAKDDEEKKEIIAEQLELNGDVDDGFATMMLTFVYMFRCLNAYYKDRQDFSKQLAEKYAKFVEPAQYEKYNKYIDKFLYYIPTLVKYDVGVTDQRSKGLLMIMGKILAQLSREEGHKGGALGSRYQTKKTAGTKI